VRNQLSAWRLLRDRWSRPRHPQALARSLRGLCAAARLTTRPDTARCALERIRARLPDLDVGRVDWSEFVPNANQSRQWLSEMLKPRVSAREKGVLFIPFENEWLRLLAHCDLAELARCYTLVLAPSSSPHNLSNYVFPAAWPGTVFTLISNRRDLEVLPRIAPNYAVVPLFASSWVDPGRFRPLPRDRRDIDLVMVANFGKVKRHHALLAALRRLPRRLRVQLIGQDQDGRTAETMRALARAYGVEDRLELRSNAAYQEVADALCRSRASVILSRREGSCVVVAESLFADTPVALLAGAEIGSSAFLNPQTGRFLPDRDLARELLDFVEQAGSYSPRRWAEENISCFHSSRTLNEVLRKHAGAAGEEWTQDIAPLCWCPFPRLVSPEDRQRLRPARQQLEARFGIAIGPPEEE
jgi:glycosyltransferase involved in cell wall biosynthesis